VNQGLRGLSRDPIARQEAKYMAYPEYVDSLLAKHGLSPVHDTGLRKLALGIGGKEKLLQDEKGINAQAGYAAYILEASTSQEIL
jgi:hypothetical protein